MKVTRQLPRRVNGIARLVLGIIPMGLALFAFTPPSQVWADEPAFTDFPYVIYCGFEGIENAYYFSQLEASGRAIYMTLDRQIGAITIDGVAERLGDDQTGSCGGKTLVELREVGRAYDLPK